MKRSAPAIWNGSGGRKASNVRPVALLVIRGVFGPAPACKIAVRVEAPTHRNLYDGERTRPNPVKIQITCAKRIGID